MDGEAPVHGRTPEGEGARGRRGGDDRFRRDRVDMPIGSDLVRQLVIVSVALVAWFGSFNFAMNLPTETADSARAEERRAERVRAAMAADSALADSVAAAAAGAAGEEGSASVVEAVTDTAPDATSAVDADPTTDTPASTDQPTEAAAPPSEPVPAEPDAIMAMEDEAAMSSMPDVSDHPPVSFESDVMPIIAGRCVQCHGEARDDGTLRIEEGLDMRTYEAIMAGSTWGDVVVPGDPVGSYMLEMILDGEMPDEGPRLLPREVRTITAWIVQGAPNN